MSVAPSPGPTAEPNAVEPSALEPELAEARAPWAPPLPRVDPDLAAPWPAERSTEEEFPPGTAALDERSDPGGAEIVEPSSPPSGGLELRSLPGSESPLQVQLADWRRRVVDLYAEVRQIARQDAERAWTRWRDVREALYRRHPMSPVPEERREAFRSSHFPYDPELRFELPVRPDPFGRGHEVGGPSSAVFLPNSGPEMLSFDRVGWIDVPLATGNERLTLFWLTGYGGGLFLPFRDATNGTQTYGAGRYLLDTAKGADLGGGSTPGTVVVDFNFAYQPSCAFDSRWSCPLAPPENRLEKPIQAGERL
jgi:hypothetical protein